MFVIFNFFFAEQTLHSNDLKTHSNAFWMVRPIVRSLASLQTPSHSWPLFRHVVLPLLVTVRTTRGRPSRLLCVSYGNYLLPCILILRIGYEATDMIYNV